MINLDFQTSKVNLLFNCMWLSETDKHMKSIINSIDLHSILLPEELDLLRQVVGRKDFNGYSMAYALNNWAGLINDENYIEQIENFLKGDLNRFEFAQELHDKLPILKSLIQKLINTKEFDKLFVLTNDYKDLLKNHWKRRQKDISGFIEGIIGPTSTDQAIAMIEAPIINNGNGFGKSKHLLFSRRHNPKVEDPKRTNLLELVYLTHESMHTHVLPYRAEQNIESRKKLHGFIQYLVDNELCYRLFKEQGISYEYGENKHHDIDDKTFSNMYPFFIGYLYRNDEHMLEHITENMQRNRSLSSKKDSNGNFQEIYSAEAIVKFFKERQDMTPYDFSNIDFNKEVEQFLVQKKSNNFNGIEI